MFIELLKLLVRFVSPYKKYFILNLFFNILSTILTLFSFATIIPILEILFKINETYILLITHFPEFPPSRINTPFSCN